MLRTILATLTKRSEVRLDRLVEKPETQQREINEATVDEYAEAMSDGRWEWGRSPIVVHGPTKTLVAGHHRKRAAVKAGRRTMPAVILRGTWQEAIFEAAKSNSGHGLMPSNADKRRAALAVLGTYSPEARAHIKFRELARKTGLSDKFLAGVAKEMGIKPRSTDRYQAKGQHDKRTRLVQRKRELEAELQRVKDELRKLK